MRTIQGFRQFEYYLKGHFWRQPIVIAPEQDFVEGLPRNKFHDDVRSVRFRFLADIEDGYNSRVRQAARSFRLPEETLAIIEFLFRRLTGQRNSLYRDHTIYRQYPSLPGPVQPGFRSDQNVRTCVS